MGRSAYSPGSRRAFARQYETCGACGKKGVIRNRPSGAYFDVWCRYCQRSIGYSTIAHNYPGLAKAAEALKDRPEPRFS